MDSFEIIEKLKHNGKIENKIENQLRTLLFAIDIEIYKIYLLRKYLMLLKLY